MNTNHDNNNAYVAPADVLEALYTTPSKSAAARKLGIARSTLYRYLRDEDIREAYTEWRRAAIADAVDSLQGVAEQAVVVLHNLANDPDAPPNVRVTAASRILEMALRAHELSDMHERLEALEKELA
jgi:AcrR family transcriptional regulator